MRFSEILIKNCPDVIIHNAGAYSIPRYITDCGFDNVFMINFLSPYYMTKTLLPYLSQKGGRVVAVGSIAHNYSKTNPENIDFRDIKAASKAYGNAKRYLMLSFYRLFENEKGVMLSVTHPGITFTNITAHYPKVIFALIKHPMKIIFMKPKKAALCLLKGVFDKTEFGTWYGPRVFNVWGLPKLMNLKTATEDEINKMPKFEYGIDWGFAVDPFAWGKLYYDKTRRDLYILDEIYKVGMLNDEAFAKIKDKGVGTDLIVADSAEPKSISEGQRQGLNIRGAEKGKDSVRFGIKWLQRLSHIYIDTKRTPNAWREFSTYEFEKNKAGEFISDYPDKDNHYIDMTRYAMEKYMKQRGLF